MATVDEKIKNKVEGLRRRAGQRDQRHRDVHDVRSGNLNSVLPGAFPDSWPKPIVADVIDTTARDLAEVTSPLPSINCTNSLNVSQRSKNSASKRTKIANWYVEYSELKKHMPQGCDWYYTYGMLPFVIEPDFDDKSPFIRIENPRHAYPEFNMKGELVSWTKVTKKEPAVLAAMYPDLASQIMQPDDMKNPSGKLELVKYCDKDRYVLYLPERQNLLLQEIPNPFHRVPVVLAQRPSFDDETRGQFDEAIWVHLARARMALLGLEATDATVGAPLAVPTDVQKVSFGRDSVIRTNSPEKIRRVGLEVPTAAFQQQQMMEQEIRNAVRQPAARTGEIDASIVTGKGVQALMGTFDTQVKTAQTVIGHAIKHVIMMCFDMDEKFWPNLSKEIRGVAEGVSFEETYRPKRDIGGNHTVDVTYGFASGMDPSRALVFLLQLRGDQLVSRDFVQRQLPMDMDIAQQQVQIDNEQVTDALKQGVFAMLQSAGVMAQQGADITQLLYQSAQIIALREKGKSMADAIIEAFAPKQEQQDQSQAGQSPAQGQQPPEQGGPGGGGPGQGPPSGMQASGLPFGVAPGQAGQGAGGRPDLQTLIASLGASGKPNLTAGVQRRIPA